MTTPFHIVIPARYQSSRLPGKLLMKIGGTTVLERVYRQAQLAKPESIIIATDNEEIASHATGFGAKFVMTAIHHQSGTDRIAEVIKQGNYQDQDIIVNLQGDEPFIAPALIRQVAAVLANTSAPVATLCWPIESLEQFNNPNVVKVVRNQYNQALYFSRSAIPAHRDQINSIALTYRHIGLYSYRAAFLLDFVTWPSCGLEQAEALEQLRILWSGYPIQVEQSCELPLQDINTLEDLESAREIAEEMGV